MPSGSNSTVTKESHIPGNTLSDPPADRFVDSDVDVHELLERLDRDDAIAVPALTGAYRAWLLEEARRARFREARPVVGRGDRVVRQRMGVHDGFGVDSRFGDLTRHYQALWDGWLSAVTPYPFDSRLVFNDRMLQVYEPGETGITPHMDRTAYRNLICLFVLEGRGRFGVCRDRSGRGARIVVHEPGDVVLTRAPGFRGSDRRPFHLSIGSPSAGTCSDCAMNSSASGRCAAWRRSGPRTGAPAQDSRACQVLETESDAPYVRTERPIP